MQTIYQLTFFLATALLAIVVTLFVLAVSLLGRAVKMASEEQEKIEKQQKENTEQELGRVQGQIEEAKKTGKIDIDGLQKKLAKINKQLNSHEARLKRIIERPKFLKAKWGVLIPSTFFIVSIVLTGIALYLVEIEFLASVFIWGIAIIGIGAGLYLICQSLRVIEGTAITSEEAASARQIDIFKRSLHEFEEGKKPRLSLRFRTIQPPFEIESGSKMDIVFTVDLDQGDIAHKAEITFYIPPGFQLQGGTYEVLPPSEYSGYASNTIKLGDIVRRVSPRRTISITAPSEAGSYKGVYFIVSEEWYSDDLKFDIVVKDKNVIPF